MPSYFANNVPERSPADQVPATDNTSCTEEKPDADARAEDLDSGARASESVVQIREDERCVPETNEGHVDCVENVPDETCQVSVEAQNEGEENTEVPDLNEAFKTTDPPTSHSNRADEEPLGTFEIPGTSKCSPDLRNPSTAVEMSRVEVSPCSEQESETELEPGDVQSSMFTIPVEEKGIASFLDSCQEALALDFEVIRLNKTDQVRVEEYQEEMSPAARHRMRLRSKGGQDCSVS